MRAVISLGSNIEPRRDYLTRALKALENLPMTRLIADSEIIETDPVGVPVEFQKLKFLNQVACFETELEVHDFSKRMHDIENSLGRVRNVVNGPRTIDLDLIDFGGMKSEEAELTLPHPRAAERDFVMGPWRQLRRTELRRNYDGYVAEYRDEQGKLPQMMQLKYVHTMAVVGNAKQIANAEGFNDVERHAAIVAALLHDTGRYEQLRRYNTFRDAASVDHAVFSHRIVQEREWLSDWPKAEREAVLSAVLYHNRRELPKDLEPLTKVASQTVRDADKLDIFRVLETLVKTTDWRNDARPFWNLQIGERPNAEVVKAIRERRPVDYQNIVSLADFVLIQVGWMISGLYYGESRRLCKERGHLQFRREFLREIGGGDDAEALCDLAAEQS